MVRRLAIVAAALAILGCSTQPPPTGPGTATLDISGSKGDCFSFGGCAWAVILRTDDEPQALDDEHDAELVSFPDWEGTELKLGRGLPLEIPDGGYTLTFEERLISDSQGSQGQLAYDVGSTCVAPFTVGAGRSVVIARVAFPSAPHEQRPCSIDLRIEAAS
jgi:hypothetical protein